MSNTKISALPSLTTADPSDLLPIVDITGTGTTKNITVANLLGTSQSSGTSGTSGTSGSSGNDGVNGSNGTHGTSGTSGSSGTIGATGTAGTSGTSGSSGTIGATGTAGTSGTSGTSGQQGSSGTNGTSGTSGLSGDTYKITNGAISPSYLLSAAAIDDIKTITVPSGLAYTQLQDIIVSDFNNINNHFHGEVQTYIGTTLTVKVTNISDTFTPSNASLSSPLLVNLDGAAGGDGKDGTHGTSGTSGTSGSSGSNGSSGTSGTSGSIGPSGTHGTSGTSGSSGTIGATGTHGTSGTSGSSGTIGATGTHGTSGTSGSSGISGTHGTSGIGTNGTSGTSGSSGNGVNGTHGTSGTSGTSGTIGPQGTGGTSGTSGIAGTHGTSGTSGVSGIAVTDGSVSLSSITTLTFSGATVSSINANNARVTVSGGSASGAPQTYQFGISIGGQSNDIIDNPLNYTFLGPNGETSLPSGWVINRDADQKITITRPSDKRVQPLVNIMTHGKNGNNVISKAPTSTSPTGYSALQLMSGTSFTSLTLAALSSSNTGHAISGATTLYITFGLIS